jgi:hypothetical protein
LLLRAIPQTASVARSAYSATFALVTDLVRRSVCLSAFLEADFYGLCCAFAAPSMPILRELSLLRQSRRQSIPPPWFRCWTPSA